MIVKDRDLYTSSKTVSLSNGIPYGTTTIQCEVQRYMDMRNLTHENAFVITCTQRFIIPNKTAFLPKAYSTQGFLTYPALITNAIKITDSKETAIIKKTVLVEYSPKTVNSSITTSQNQSTSAASSTMQQYTSGSSTSQTNSYGLDLSLGFTGKAPTGSVNFGGNRSKTNESSDSQTVGGSEESGSQYSSDASMSLKDWSGFIQLDKGTNTMPTWIWSQEYPWNLIQFRTADEKEQIELPQYVIDLLYDGTQILPPSQLSQFGVNFVSKVTWIVFLESDVVNTTSLQFDSVLTLCEASHQLLDKKFVAKINTYPPTTTSMTGLDLPVLALDPIGGANGDAVVGFQPNAFDVKPTATGSMFAVTADSNLLLVRGKGFTGVTQSEFMTTDFTKGDVTITLFVKMIDGSDPVNLSFKHWTDKRNAVKLSIKVNDSAKEPKTAIIKYADSTEAGSGGDNVTVVPLRRMDFTSVDFCNLLQFGLNKIEVTFSSDVSGTQYTLMAVAVG